MEGKKDIHTFVLIIVHHCQLIIKTCSVTPKLGPGAWPGISVRSIKPPPSLARNALMNDAEQCIQTNDHVSELASNGFFGSHHIVNVINTINLGFAHRSMKCLSHESQCLSKMTALIATSHFLGIKDLMEISYKLVSIWPCSVIPT